MSADKSKTYEEQNSGVRHDGPLDRPSHKSRSESGICFRMRLTEALLHRRRDHADSPGNYVPSPCTWLSPVLYFFPAASSISTNVPTKIVEELKNGQKVPQNVKKWPKNAQKRLKTAKNSKKWPKIENL